MFGPTLRRIRLAHGLSMGAFARGIGVTTPYVSDVERSRRGPLSPTRLLHAARFLGLGRPEVRELLIAAAEDRGEFCMPARVGTAPHRLEVAAELVSRFEALSDADVDAVGRVLGVERAA